MLKKVSGWGHKGDKDWAALVKEEFSRPFNGTDFVHGYQWDTITPVHTFTEKMNEFTALGIKYSTDKAYFHRYTDFYYEYFKTMKDKKLNILELGVSQGSSLLALRDYFTNSAIYGIDIFERSIKDYGPRITTYLCSQDDEEKLNQLFKDIQFDIIIDDGSHMTLHQLKSLEILFKKVNPGGLYICEDIHTSLRTQYINSTTRPLDMFEKFCINNRTLNIPEINKDDNDYINNNIRDIVVYRRTLNAYECYSCRNANANNSDNCKYCNTNLSPSDLSSSAIIFKLETPHA
jgi:hypothetical protein